MKHYILIALAALAAIALTVSCDDDIISERLDGVWSGQVTSGWGWRTNYQYVDIEFYNDPYQYASGSGIEYDYDRDGHYHPVRFNFTVSSGNIYLDYEDGTSVYISDYGIQPSRFHGTFRDRYDGRVLGQFEFYRVDDWRYKRGGYSRAVKK